WVDLAAIRQPVLNLYALADHLVPPAASAAMERCLGSRDYTGCGIDTGHIGMVARRRGADAPPDNAAVTRAARARTRSPRVSLPGCASGAPEGGSHRENKNDLADLL